MTFLSVEPSVPLGPCANEILQKFHKHYSFWAYRDLNLHNEVSIIKDEPGALPVVSLII